MTLPERIETENLILRSFQSQDLESLVETFGNWEVTKWLSTNVNFPFTEADGEEFIALAISEFQDGTSFRYAVEDKASGRVAGNIRIFSVKEETEVGYSLHPDFWGKGLATEILSAAVEAGFDTGVITKFIALTLDSNYGSQRVLEKIGFIYDGATPPEYDRSGHSPGGGIFYRLEKPTGKNSQ